VWSGGMCCTVILWLTLDAQQSRRVARDVQSDAAQAQNYVDRTLADCLRDMALVAETIRTDGERSEAAKDSLGSFIGGRPGALGIGFVGPDRKLRWLETRAGYALPGRFADLGSSDDLDEAIEAGEPTTVRPPRSLWNGRWVLVGYTPLQPG